MYDHTTKNGNTSVGLELSPTDATEALSQEIRRLMVEELKTFKDVDVDVSRILLASLVASGNQRVVVSAQSILDQRSLERTKVEEGNNGTERGKTHSLEDL